MIYILTFRKKICPDTHMNNLETRDETVLSIFYCFKFSLIFKIIAQFQLCSLLSNTINRTASFQ